MDVVNDFLHQVHGATRLKPKAQAEKLRTLLGLHPANNPYIVKIHNSGDVATSDIEKLVAQRNFYNDDWLAFQTAVVLFVRMANSMNPWSTLESYDLFAMFLNDLVVAFTNKSRGYLLSSLLQDTINFVLPLAAQLDIQLLPREANRKPRLIHLASLLLRVFNNIRSQLGAGDVIEAVKKSIMLFVGLKLCSVYFRSSNPLLCRNVFSNMSNANLRFLAYPKNEQLQFRYYLAKFYLVKYQFVDAFQHLGWCLENCPRNYQVDNHNVTLILRDLIPVGLILGKMPKVDAIRRKYYSSPAASPKFLTLYMDLAIAIRTGNFLLFHEIVRRPENADFLKRHQLLLALGERANIGILRNLLKRAHLLDTAVAKISYDSVRAALQVSMGGLQITDLLGPKRPAAPAELDDFLVENYLITLIDQNLVKGKLFPRLRVVSLSKTDAFPNQAHINFVKFGNGKEGVLSNGDEWMAV